MRRDIFYQQVRYKTEDTKYLYEDELLDNYISGIKINIKQLITTTTKDDFSTDSTVFKMEVAIMNTQEYRRLKEIEKQYERILSYGAQWRWRNDTKI